jgi:hypothetical protein
MKNVLKTFGIIALVAVIGFSFAACDVDDQSHDSVLNGTWTLSSGSNVVELKLKSGNYEESLNGNPISKATYSTQEGEIFITPTHIYGTYFTFTDLEPKWYTKDELKGLPGFNDASLNSLFSIKRGTYSVNGNTLTITIYGGGTRTYTKK